MITSHHLLAAVRLRLVFRLVNLNVLSAGGKQEA